MNNTNTSNAVRQTRAAAYRLSRRAYDRRAQAGLFAMHVWGVLHGLSGQALPAAAAGNPAAERGWRAGRAHAA